MIVFPGPGPVSFSIFIYPMKKFFLYIFPVALALVMTGAATDEFPQAAITNGIVHARFYLPDTGKGYYRGTRFDWSGVLPDLSYNGHTYCAVWFNNYTPTTNDAIMGPVESFAPLGYEQAKPGGRFVQPGVGALSKSKDAAYSPFAYYPILNAGTWKLKKKKSSIEFTHTLTDSAYSYVYKKTVSLVKGKAVLVLDHSLENTGRQTIETSVYNHNLFVFDQQPTGPDFVVQFPFKPTGALEGQKGTGTTDLAAIKDSGIVFNRPFDKKEYVYSILEGYTGSEQQYDIKIENHKTGAAVRITSDQPISKLAFWGSSRIFSPEPFIHISVLPGKTFTWKIYYEFYTCSIKP
jgi:hypothetical protein